MNTPLGPSSRLHQPSHDCNRFARPELRCGIGTVWLGEFLLVLACMSHVRSNLSEGLFLAIALKIILLVI
jgi:hypothetical protein